MSQAQHHANAYRVSSGGEVIPKTPRATSLWRRWQQESACRRTVGHCWHAEEFIAWFCCSCGAETDGMPPQQCKLCDDVA